MLRGQPGELGWFRLAPVERPQQVPWPAGHVFVVATSGAAEKTGTAQELYNQASLAAQEALALWNAATGRSHRPPRRRRARN